MSNVSNKNMKWMGAGLAAALLVFAASCGGTTAGFTPESDVPAAAVNAPLGSPLPSLPADLSGVASRGASDVSTIPGSSAIMSSGGTVEGESLGLTSAPGEMAWALYKVEGLAGRNVSTLGIEVLTGSLTTEYSVGVSNFSEGVWDFLQAGVLPEFEYDLSGELSRLTSQLGNLYFVVVVADGAGATIQSASVISEQATSDEDRLPGMAQRPSVSEGLADRIEISWEAVDGAASYELERMAETAGDEQWEALASLSELRYTDTAIELSVEYKYRVRAINASGAGGYSRARSGYAGPAPTGFDEAEDEDMELTGVIEVLNESSITIGGQSFAITSVTQFLDNNNMPIEFAGLAVGMLVEVEVDADGAGGWTALKIKLETEDEAGDDNGDDGTEDEGGDDNGDDGTEDEGGDDNGDDGTEDEGGDDNI
jgi:hypothetical protein